MWGHGWIILFTAVAMMLFSSWCGLGFTYDSYDYLAAANSIRAQQELLNADGSPFVFHAPLFPIVLSFFGDQAIHLLKYANLLSLAASMMLIGRMIRSQISNTWIFNLCMAAIGLSVGMQMIHHFIWSEPLFLTLLAAHNLFLLRFLHRERKVDFYGLILSAFFLAITRNAGFFFILPSAITLFIFASERRWIHAISYFAFGSSGFAAWNAYVTFLKGGTERIYGDNPFFVGLWDNIVNYLDIVSLWFFPSLIPLVIRIVLLLATSSLLFIYFRKYINDTIVVMLGAQFLSYLAIMIVLLSVDHDEIERLLAVVYPCVICALFISVDVRNKSLSSSARKFLIAGLILWGSYVAIRGVNNNLRWYYNRCTEQVGQVLEIEIEYAEE